MCCPLKTSATKTFLKLNQFQSVYGIFFRCCQLDGDPKEISPVFTQFLESVWNLTEQFPQAFEYNEAFLLQIHEHVHSCQFGNFLGNCQKEREELK